MKKIILSLFLLLSFTSLMMTSVNAYSPHYLPGGKNYISSDNLLRTGDYIATINAFSVKPYTEYTFSVPRDLFDSEPFFINLYFLNNDTYLNDVSYDEAQMSFESSTNIWYFTFTTPAEGNYLEFDFNDNGAFVEGAESIGLQLEEGNIPTTYETYVEGEVIDTSSPYFIGEDTIISYYDQPITVSEIQSSLTAYDDIDGDLTASITIKEDNYTANMNVLGTYTVIFTVNDNSMNSSDITINVQLVDVLSPVFSQLNTVTAVYPNTYTVSDIKAMLSASDNYDGDVSSQITLVEDTYTASSSIVGNYQMQFQVSDSSGNISYYTQDIAVVDNEGPVISGSSSLNVGYNQLLTPATVISSLSVIDNYDDQTSLTLILETDNYSSNYNILGDYTMNFSATDSSGNKTYKTVTINVVDEIGPIVYFDSSIIQVYSDTVLSLPDFAQLLVKTSELNAKEDYFITIKYDNYTNHATKPGTYHMSLDFKDNYGTILNKNFQIHVIDRDYDYIYSPQETPSFFAESILQPNPLFAVGGLGLLTISSGGIIIYRMIKRRDVFKMFYRK